MELKHTKANHDIRSRNLLLGLNTNQTFNPIGHDAGTPLQGNRILLRGICHYSNSL